MLTKKGYKNGNSINSIRFNSGGIYFNGYKFWVAYWPSVWLFCARINAGTTMPAQQGHEMSIEVRVIEISTGDMVKSIDCPSQGTADKVEKGMNININYDEYYTIQVEGVRDEKE